MAGVTSCLLNNSPARVRVQLPGLPPLLNTTKAYKLAVRIFHENGFLTIRKSAASCYLKRTDSNFLVRLSDHKKSNKDLSKVHYDLVFDYDTIKADVESRCQSVIRRYSRR